MSALTRSRRELLPGVFLTCLQTEKFKTGLLSLHLLTPLDRETAAQNALIPSVLRRGTVRYPDMGALGARLDELYGARLEPSVRKLGEIQAVGFVTDFVEVPGQDVLEDMAALLGEALLSPNTRGGLLLPRYVESEREKLLEDIRARVNDRAEYARQRLIELMCPGEAYAVDGLGDEDAAGDIGYVALTRHYKALLAASPIEIFYCGAADADRVAAAMKDALAMLPRGELNFDIGTDIRMNTVEDTARVFTEEMDVGQGKLVLGYRLGDAMEDPDMAALQVMNYILGDPAGASYVSSKLFLHVRERQSLCYYVDSELDLMKGLMIVASGIDPADHEKTMAEIGRQVQAVKDGDFTDGELRTARAGLSARMLSLTDDPARLEKFWLGQNVLGLDYGPEELAALALDVTREDVIRAAAGIECDGVYFLRGAEGDDDEEN